MRTQKIITTRRVDTEESDGVVDALLAVVAVAETEAGKTGSKINWDTVNIRTEVGWIETVYMTSSASRASRDVRFVLEVEASK